VVEWLTLLLRIWEVSGSNLGPETEYSERSFVVFPSPLDNAGIVPQTRPRLIPSTSFPIHHSLAKLSFDDIQSELLRKHR
jgi:hypothetical protein